MEARAARKEDAREMVRLAAIMFGSMGFEWTEPGWEAEGRRQVAERLGADLAPFVVDHPQRQDRLVASAAGTIARRLPGPGNPRGRAGYIQWVCTDAEFRNQGLGNVVMRSLLSWYEERGVEVIELHATAAAELFYRKLGFDDSGPRALRRKPW